MKHEIRYNFERLNKGNSFRPMLAAKGNIDDLSKMEFPVYATPKIDGIRIVCHPELGVVSRSLKPIGNEYIRNTLDPYRKYGFDGEVVIGDPTDPNIFNKTTGAVRRRDGEPDFTYLIFDTINNPHHSHKSRLDAVCTDIRHNIPGTSSIRLLSMQLLNDFDELTAFYQKCIAEGYEGICVRDPYGLYKYNRATLKQGGLIKFKSEADAEAEIIGYEPLMRNHNAAEQSEVGLQTRSKHKENLVADDMMGKILVRGINEPFEGVEFAIGTGFDEAARCEFWDNQDEFLGRIVTFTYQPVGIMDKPRIPVFKGFRDDL